ncbi:MAG: Na/Pi cotransporter family protein [Proteobacteria bacterium]|nr:Na/Pi cotransporter family protein [Pseudomonadota bacterium]
MSGTRVLIDLAGEVGLLLWGTHMVSTGVQRGYGIPLRRALERNLARRPLAFLSGIGITTLLQSSTATGLMAMSFTAAGVLALAPALAVMLGANVGTALVAQVLSFNAALLAPPLLLGGVLTFRWSRGSRVRNLGRAAIGLGLMIMALAGLQQTLGPVENTPLLRSILQSLAGEPLLALLISLLLTWACHSSVAIVLLVSSLLTTHVIGAPESLALVLGANLGGAMPALIHASTPTARRLPLGNLLVRAAGALVALPWLGGIAQLLQRIAISDDRLAVDFHLAFNLVLALAFLPFVQRFADLLLRWLPEPVQPVDPGRALYLEVAALDSTTVALANATRETLRMADMVEDMLRRSLTLLRSGDRAALPDISAADAAVGRLGSAIRGYLVAIGSEQSVDDAREGARVQDILSAVINLEHVSDIVANSLTEFLVKQQKRGQILSDDEIAAISTMHGELLESLQLAMAVFLRAEPADATRLLQRKTRLRELEAHATTLAVERLRDAALARRAGTAGTADAAGAGDESGVLRVARDLRRIHSHLASFAYPAVHRVKPTAAARLRARRAARKSPTRETAPPAGPSPGDAPGS